NAPSPSRGGLGWGWGYAVCISTPSSLLNLQLTHVLRSSRLAAHFIASAEGVVAIDATVVACCVGTAHHILVVHDSLISSGIIGGRCCGIVGLARRGSALCERRVLLRKRQGSDLRRRVRRGCGFRLAHRGRGLARLLPRACANRVVLWDSLLRCAGFHLDR